MASGSKLGEVFVAITGRDMGLKAALGQAQGDTEVAAGRMSATIGSLAATMGKALLAIGAATLIQDSLQAAGEQEQNLAKLRSALSATGDAAEETVSKLRDFADAMQEVTVHDDDVIVAGMAQAKAMGVQTSQLEAATRAAIGLSARYSLDLSTAFMLVGRAAAGQTSMLTRYGIVLKETGDKTKAFDEVLRLGADSFHYATAQAQTSQGKFEQLKNTLGDISKTIGIALLPILNVLFAVIKPAIELVGSLGEGFWKWVLGIAAGIAAVVTVINVVSKLKQMWEGVTKAVTAAKAAMQDWKAVALSIAAITAVTIAFSQANASADDGLKELLDGYQRSADQQQRAAEAAQNATTDAVADSSKKIAVSKAEQKAEEEFHARRDVLKERAQAILDVAKATRVARMEEAQRRREQIGWTGAEEVWKNAAVAGERQRFYQRPMTGRMTWNGPLEDSPALPNNQFSHGELVAALRQMTVETATQTKYLAQAVRFLDPTMTDYLLNQ